MTSGYTVERNDLRAWAAQVGRGSDDLGAGHKYAQAHIADGDFGMILDILIAPYTALIEKFHHVLDEGNVRLGKAGEALTAAERTYQDMEVRAADEFAPIG